MTEKGTYVVPISVPWGKITLHLDNDEFRAGYETGYAYYGETVEADLRKASMLMVQSDLLEMMTIRDATGVSVFDRTSPGYGEYMLSLEWHLGFFLGYMSGPLSIQMPAGHEDTDPTEWSTDSAFVQSHSFRKQRYRVSLQRRMLI